MRWVRFAVLVLLATVLQASFLANLNIKPDLLLILLVFFAIFCDPTEAIISSFAIGFAADIVSSSMGPKMISFGLLGTALTYLRRVITIKKMPYQGLAIFATGILTGILVYLLSFIKREPIALDKFTVVFGIAVSSGIVGPFLFLPSAWWMRFGKKHPGRR